MKSEDLRRKRSQNEQVQDELMVANKNAERLQENYEHLFYKERQLNEELLSDYQGTSSQYRYEEFAEKDKVMENKVMESFEDLKEGLQKKRKQLSDENENLYQEELKLLRMNEDDKNGKG